MGKKGWRGHCVISIYIQVDIDRYRLYTYIRLVRGGGKAVSLIERETDREKERESERDRERERKRARARSRRSDGIDRGPYLSWDRWRRRKRAVSRCGKSVSFTGVSSHSCDSGPRTAQGASIIITIVPLIGCAAASVGRKWPQSSLLNPAPWLASKESS